MPASYHHKTDFEMLPNKFVRISAININSITAPARLQELQNFVDSKDVSILALTETKLDSTIHPSLYQLNGFHAPVLNNRTRKGGGVAIFVRNTLPFSHIPSLESNSFETIWVKVRVQKSTLLICSSYLPPHTAAHKQCEFLDYLSDSILEAQKYLPDLITLVGDWNAGNSWLPHNAPHHSPITSFEVNLKNVTETLELSQLINTATRIQHGTHNLRDLAFVDRPQLIKAAEVTPPFSSIDHQPLLITLTLQTSHENQQPTIKIWDYKSTDIEGLTRTLSAINWSEITDKDIDEAVELLSSTIITAANQHIPTKLVRVRNDKPWFSAELRREMRKRDRLFRQARRRNTEQDWMRWRCQRNVVTSLNRKLKNENLKEKINALLDSKKSPYKYHQIIKSITGFKRSSTIPPLTVGDDILSEDHHKAEAFNSYFSSQTDIDVSNHHTESLERYKSNHIKTPHVFHFTPISPREVLKIINVMDASKACGSDGIPTKLIKMIAIYIAEPLSQIFNESVKKGKYPTKWKSATVKPVNKGRGSPSEPASYRPISLLPCISKIFEKLTFQQLYDHISSNSLITQKQSGYRPGHNTELQLIYLTDKIYRAMNSGDDYTIVYLDISRYFEKIWHEGLLAKCDVEFGIRGAQLHWLESYLRGRQQIVHVGHSTSTPRTLDAGVPQGSVLGPLLAIMYLNGLSNITKNEMLFFADDSSLHVSHNSNNFTEVERALQQDLECIKSYGNDWIVAFNTAKTAQQTFTNKAFANIPALSFDEMAIPIHDAHKHLGITISADLRFKSHVNNILLKFNRTLSPLYSIASLIPRQVLLHIYQIYAQPHLDYCDTVYDGHLTVFDKSRLEKAQNRAARLITSTPRRTPTAGLLTELGWTSLEDRRRTHRLQVYHKVRFDDRIPKYIKDIIPNTRSSEPSRNLRSTQNNQLTLPITRKASFARSFIPKTTKIWNELPITLSDEHSNKKFKKGLREFNGNPSDILYFTVGSKEGNKLHTRIRLNSSDLNEHKVRLGKSDSPSCDCGAPKESTEHFVLSCPLYHSERMLLFNDLSTVLDTDFTSMSRRSKIELLMNGPRGNTDIKTKVALAFQQFIQQTRRFSHNVRALGAQSSQ